MAEMQAQKIVGTGHSSWDSLVAEFSARGAATELLAMLLLLLLALSLVPVSLDCWVHIGDGSPSTLSTCHRPSLCWGDPPTLGKLGIEEPLSCLALCLPF